MLGFEAEPEPVAEIVVDDSTVLTYSPNDTVLLNETSPVPNTRAS